jgi:hypothetical protein
MMKRTLLWLAAPAVVLALVLGGCSKGNSQAQGDDVVAPNAPPAAQAETQSPQPGPDYVWIQGYWVWGGNGYNWTPGFWQQPPQTGYVWVAPQYEHIDRGYRYRSGRWSVSVGGVHVEGNGSRPEQRQEGRAPERRDEREHR